jgi:hypothetical protein
MKRSLIALTVAASMLLSACGASEKTIDGIRYGTYGLVNEKEMRNPNIKYEMSGWSIFWSVLLVETVIAPIYIIGWDLFEPVGKKDPNAVQGQVN